MYKNRNKFYNANPLTQSDSPDLKTQEHQSTYDFRSPSQVMSKNAALKKSISPYFDRIYSQNVSHEVAYVKSIQKYCFIKIFIFTLYFKVL